jgi:cell division protease FtsH
MEMKREHHIHFWYIIVALLALLLLENYLAATNAGSGTKTVPYSEFQTLLQGGKIDNLQIGQNSISGDYKNPEKGQPSHFFTERVDPALAQQLEKSNVTFSGAASPGLIAGLLGWFMPLLGFVLLWMFLVRPMASGGMGGMGGLMSIGRSRAKVFVETDTKTTFGDVAGVDEAKDELKEIVDFLKDPKAWGRLGAHIPKGILLVGPPGTGKTLLARAVAGEAGVPFFSISGSEFVEMFVGVGAARVRDMFQQAREKAPAIIFIDEIDSLGRSRGGSYPGGGHDEKEQTLNQLLAEMDGFDPKIGVVVLAATNRPEVLDPALLRAGRFDRQVLVDRPDKKGRADILRLYLKKISLAPNVSPEDIAALTPGFTGADLANLVNEAALLATRRQGEDVTLHDFGEAVERVIAGLEKHNRVLNPHEREVVAHHEIGHALVAMALPKTDPVQKISIIPRGIAALGYTLQRPMEEHFLMDRGELLNRMAVLLGGRAAESLIFSEISTGAADDLVKATEIARSMVARFGMDPELGQVAYEPQQQHMLATAEDWRPRLYGDDTATRIDHSVRTLIEGAYTRARAILASNRDLLLRAAAQLLSAETLEDDALKTIARAVVVPQAAEAKPAA